MPEGSYPVKATLSYLDLNGNKIKELTATDTLIVDRVLPTSQITYPGESLMLCPIKVSDTKGDWFGIPIEGIAMDNINVKQYELYYGIGDNPLQWLTATTKKMGKIFPIIQTGPAQGQIGIWDVKDLHGTDFSLKLKVIDVAGNVSCHTTSFSVDTQTEIADLSTDKSLFSPNGDGFLDDMNVNYQIDEYATVDVKVFRLLEDSDGSYVLDSTPVRTIVSGQQHLGGTETTLWDGKDDSNTTVPDGLYAVAVFATDSCNNANSDWVDVEVDNSPPVTVITYPGLSDPLGNIVEVKGTADDLHFQRYTLEAGQGDNPDTWTFILSNTNPVTDDILGIWNTYGLEGTWTLRLTAADIVGNESTATVTIDIGVRGDLITDLNVTPKLFSPNNDGKLDTANINYTLTDACQVRIDISDAGAVVIKTYTTDTPSSGTYTYIWDGKDNDGATVADGPYTVRLSAALSSNPVVTQEEAVTLSVDSTPPTIYISQPLSNSYYKGSTAVTGTISDGNLLEYSVSYSGTSGTVLLDKANQSRVNHTFGILNELPDGIYTLNAVVSDLGENTNEINIPFTVDRTAPKVAITTPLEDEYYGSTRNIIAITGSIVEANLDTYILRYGSGDNPAQWTGLLSGTTMPTDSLLFSWAVSGLADGIYTISFYVQDKAGLAGEALVRVMVDNTLPETAIASPSEGNYIKTATDIKGTAYDFTLDKYTLEISEGSCSNAFKWAVMKTATNSVKDGVIFSWQVLPSDGNYCFRLTAVDKLGNTSEAKTNVKVDTHPPMPPVLSGNVENKSNARLTWTQNTEPDFAGYNLYRDDQKINTSLMACVNYLDENLPEGIHAYTVTAVDLAGNESKPSNEVKLRVDFTGPDANIRSPLDGSMVSGIVDIKGTAYSSDDFKQYRIYIGQGQNPSAWNLIRTSPVPVSYGILTQWDTLGLTGLYSIKLEAEDLTGNINIHQIAVTIDDLPPAAPVLISAVADDSNVTLTWQANTETDLAGYLLYRNNQLANVSGMVTGDLKPYLISGTTYLDVNLPDGKFKYYLIAMDQAGNTSDQSNILEVEIDTHPPHATIIEPPDGTKFESKIAVGAESPDVDIESIQFQYKKVIDAIWINLGNPVTKTPYIINLDPVALGLTYDDYHLRAVATDKGGKTDLSPSSIIVTYTDQSAPEAPLGLKAATNGQDVTLTWDANTESDLKGYNVYRISGTTKVKINSSIITETTYQDTNLPDGTYTYEVTALDTYDNESNPSNAASANIYAPSIDQPYTPTDQQTITVNGSKAEADSTVEIFVDTGSGPVSQGTIPSDGQGNFVFDITFSLGENRITAKATDNAGNISRSSDMVIVVYDEPPAAPTGLVTSVQNYDVNLTWNPNAEPDLSGYNLYRNDEKLNAPAGITSGTITASSNDYDSLPENAFDSDPDTFWMSVYSYGTFNPEWWKIDLPSPELISHIEIHWQSELYAGKDYEVQVWSGYAWITKTKVTGNALKDNTFDFKPSYRTDKIRIYITDSTNTDYYKQVGISEIKILKDNLISDPSYQDTSLHDGNYTYTVAAVDYYGFESLPSEETPVAVGDVEPPSSPLNLTATPSGSNVILNWSANLEPDIAGYNVYRNSPDGWLKINSSLILEATYTDSNLLNGTYTYRVTALDTTGNESLPSNEASVTVNIGAIQPPQNLSVTPVPEGGALSLTWEYPGDPVAGYNLYRSTTSGGPYTKVNALLITSTAYLDTGLTNGTTYYYVVTAVDSIGNQSAYSNEAMGIPSDTVAPNQPVIFFPTKPGNPILLYNGKTDISGIAEPASTIELFKNGVSAGKTSGYDKDTIQGFTIDSDIYEVSISPDGKTLLYVNNDSIYLKTLSTGSTVKIIE
jgi:fibronectin type 3 domain-containing protein/flagellar hook assembly protein FlgD